MYIYYNTACKGYPLYYTFNVNIISTYTYIYIYILLVTTYSIVSLFEQV